MWYGEGCTCWLTNVDGCCLISAGGCVSMGDTSIAEVLFVNGCDNF